MLTPVQELLPRRWFKRDDLACYVGPHLPSGSKVRQYLGMAAGQPPGTPMIVGCSAHSAQQIYVADAAARTHCPGIVFVPARKARTQATEWCASRGATVIEVRPGYPSVYRKQAKLKAQELGGCVRWDRSLAIEDTAEQVLNLPPFVERVVVPVGSGLVVCGVLLGLARQKRSTVVIGIAVSGMADRAAIVEMAQSKTDLPLPPFGFKRHPALYENSVDARLPSGELLDPFYAAKCLEYMRDGDCLWLTGCRGDLSILLGERNGRS